MTRILKVFLHFHTVADFSHARTHTHMRGGRAGLPDIRVPLPFPQHPLLSSPPGSKDKGHLKGTGLSLMFTISCWVPIPNAHLDATGMCSVRGAGPSTHVGVVPCMRMSHLKPRAEQCAYVVPPGSYDDSPAQHHSTMSLSSPSAVGSGSAHNAQVLS